RPPGSPHRRRGHGGAPRDRFVRLGNALHAPRARGERRSRQRRRGRVLGPRGPIGYSLESIGRGRVLTMTARLRDLCLAAIGVLATSAGPARADWAMFHGDPRHSGASGIASMGVVAWSFTTSDTIEFTSPAVGPDGTIYVANLAGDLLALRNGGNLRW